MSGAHPFPATRIVRGATSATLSHQFTDQHGEPAAPSGTATVAVTRSDGTAVTASAVAGTLTAARMTTIAAAELVTVDVFTVTWSVDGVVVAVDKAEVVGGVLHSLGAMKAVNSALNGQSDENLRRTRQSVEDTLLAELGRSPVERLVVEQHVARGGCTLLLDWPDLREVVWATDEDGTAIADVTAVPADDAGIAYLENGWPCGRVTIAYRFGMTSLPGDLADNLTLAYVHHLGKILPNVPFQSETIRTAEGVLISLARPGVGSSITGNDEVDASIRRHQFKRPGIA